MSQWQNNLIQLERTTPQIEALSDEELVAQIVRTRNAMLFEQIYDRYAQRIYNKCHSFSRSEEEARDLTQDVFLHLFLKLPTFKGVSKFSTWVYSLTYNFCVNYVNRDKQRKIKDNSVRNTEIEETSDVADVDESEFLAMRADRLRLAMEQISPEDKSILLLKYQDNVSVKDLQELLEIGESAVKMRLKRAKAKVLEAYHKLP